MAHPPGEGPAKFINRYVFPGGELDLIANIERVMEACDFAHSRAAG